MSARARITANRRNAALSTGPTTDAGKAVARMNALSHGLRATSPVVPGEDPAAWEGYREAIVADLAPVGALEEELADRVAVLSWRLRRVSAFEAAAVARASDKAARKARGDDEVDERLGISAPVAGTPKTVQVALDRVAWLESAERSAGRASRLLAELVAAKDESPLVGEDAVFLLGRLSDYLPPPDDDLADEFEDDGFDEDEFEDDDEEGESDPMTSYRHPRFLLALGVPSDLHDEPQRWCGWTAGAVRKGAERLAKAAEWSAARLLEQATRDAAREVEQRKREAADLRGGMDLIRRLTTEAETAARRRALVPFDFVDKLTRYEGHLQRQLTQTLHELERRQALRSDHPPQPPAVLDVTVHASDGVPFPALEG